MKKRFLNVAYEDRDLAKRLGARWDPALKRWYYPKNSPLAKVFGWRAAAADTETAIASNDPQTSKPQSPSMSQSIAPSMAPTMSPPPSSQGFGDLFDQPAARYG